MCDSEKVVVACLEEDMRLDEASESYGATHTEVEDTDAACLPSPSQSTKRWLWVHFKSQRKSASSVCARFPEQSRSHSNNRHLH